VYIFVYSVIELVGVISGEHARYEANVIVSGHSVTAAWHWSGWHCTVNITATMHPLDCWNIALQMFVIPFVH